MELFYFTFGMGHEQAMCCQPIYAKDKHKARKKMESVYGNKWAFQYTEEEYNQNIEEGFSEKLLKPLTA